ncbi:7 transmembrane sweet-taste receptor of 3 GCPR-domain-containing protein [Phlyctochytrium arcticum]|nr:7 transmembrane sweet-taste receptor of 3 GCPR-domain-containing protein [Phlyctochytrium arcticum]
MQGNKRDALLMKLADDDRSNAYGKRDEIMARIAATLQIAPSRVIFRSFVNASTNSLRRRDAANNSSFAISFSVLKEDNSYIEGNDLQLFQLKLTASGIASDVDYIPTEQRSIDARAVGPAIVLALSAFTACFATFLIVNLFYYRAHREVRKLAPIFSAQMIFGTIIACGLIFLYTWRPSEKICSAQVWMGGAAFSLVFGNIIGKNYRIHRIFRNRGKFVMTDTMVIPIPMTLLFGELVLDAIWTALSPLQPTLVDIGNTRYWTCSSDSNVSLIMTGVTFGYKLVLMGMAFALAYSTRRAYGGYAESK